MTKLGQIRTDAEVLVKRQDALPKVLSIDTKNMSVQDQLDALRAKLNELIERLREIHN
jgi:hypothetical protein